MGTNHILEFSRNASALVLTDSEYSVDGERIIGNQPGIARADFVNKILKQSALMSAVLAQFIVDNSGEDVQDDQAISLIVTNFITSLNLASGAQVGDVKIVTMETVPSGFLECDGSSLLRSLYPDLFSVIGTAWGAIDSTHFSIPDFRGKFIRGWAHGSTSDPDRDTRTAQVVGGITGDKVGSVQADEYKSHRHKENRLWPGGVGEGNERALNAGGYEGLSLTDYSGGNETRPINANVMFIIKF